MTIQISKDEMRLLAYLHEHAQGFDDRFAFHPAKIATDLGITKPQLQRDSSFLSSHGLTGVRSLNMTTFNAVTHSLSDIWLTGHGENLMRTLENQMEEQLLNYTEEPSAAGRITLKVMSFLWDKSQDIVVGIVSQYIGNHIS